MNYLKRILLIIIVFLIILIVVSMFLPSSTVIEKKVVIDNNKEVIEEQLHHFQIHKLLHYVIKKDDGIWSLTEQEEGVELTGSLIVDYGFNPITKFNALFHQEKLTMVFGKQLDSLKAYIENLPKIHRVKVEKKFMGESLWYLSVRDTINQRESSNIHGKLFTKINQFMDEQGIVSDDSPFVIYHLWTDSIVDLEAGIPVKDSTLIGNKTINLRKIASGNVVTAIHYGPYERLPETYFGINEWMRKNKVVVIGSPWESYITDPAKETNPEKWQTAVFFPIE
ncbi:MAG: hypothetical protein J5I47_12810 [Vicingus serpentipes]|nr:hypothetical protein [Vicingus serpentipes]